MYKKSLVIIAVIAINLVAFSQSRYSNDQVEVIPVSDHIFLLKESYNFTANVVVVAGEDELLIIDTGFREVARDLFKAVSSLEKKATVIVNSHSHHDHIGANGVFGSDVKVIGHESCSEQLNWKGQQVITFDKKYKFDFSGFQVHCTSFAGAHSECDLLLHIPALKIACLGDLYLSESFPLVNTDKGFKVQRLVSHLKEIHALLPEGTTVFPGHGKQTSREGLGEYIQMVESTIGIVRGEMDKGIKLQEMKASDLLADWDQWGTFFPFITKDSWIEQIYLSYSS